MGDRHPDDLPLPPQDAFNVAVRLLVRPRANPADDPRPAANGEVDEAAVRRAARLLERVLG